MAPNLVAVLDETAVLKSTEMEEGYLRFGQRMITQSNHAARPHRRIALL